MKIALKKKSFIKICLVFVLFLSLVLLTACGETAYFTISALPSDAQLGSIDGVQDESLSEGTRITLTAREKNAETNPFLCWVHNDGTIVSTNTNLDLTYNESTQGNYTAIFAEQSPSQMMYASITQISATLPSDVASLDVVLLSATVEDGSNIYSTKLSGNLENGILETDKTSVVCFRDETGSNSFTFQLQISINYTDGSHSTQSYTLNFNTTLTRTLFGSNSTYSISQNDTNLGTTISITFEKLSVDLIQSINID